jgi:hypothetical protein
MKTWIICAACALAVTVESPVLAQSSAPSAGCGSMENAQGELEGFEKYFRDDEYANVRRNVIRKLTADESQMVVTNQGKCQAVLQAALTMLRRYDPDWSRDEQRGYDFTVLQYGPYYAILVKVGDDPVSGPAAYYPLIVFQSRGLSYVTTIIV